MFPMRDRIIGLTINHLKKDGLKFSIDEIAKELKISKKTIYRYFSNKESLAMAVFDYFYDQTILEAKEIVASEMISKTDLLKLYLTSFKMIDRNLFNKFKLNDSTYKYAICRHQDLFLAINSYLPTDDSTLFVVNSTLEMISKNKFPAEKEEEIIIKVAKLWNI